jgi:hypothetical protein
LEPGWDRQASSSATHWLQVLAARLNTGRRKIRRVVVVVEIGFMVGVWCRWAW